MDSEVLSMVRGVPGIPVLWDAGRAVSSGGRSLHAVALASAGAGAACLLIVCYKGKVVSIVDQGSAAVQSLFARVVPGGGELLRRLRAVVDAAMTPTSADPPILHMRPDVPPTFWDPERSIPVQQNPNFACHPSCSAPAQPPACC
jgi:hypothetical protein